MITHTVKAAARRAFLPKSQRMFNRSFQPGRPSFGEQGVLEASVMPASIIKPLTDAAPIPNSRASDTGASDTAASDTAASDTAASDTAASDTGASQTGASHTRIKLLVGERTFITTRDTLIRESQFFSRHFSGPWAEPPQDGIYFVDADPALFEHILRYLRQSVFPLFYRQSIGHNLGLYAALRKEAEFFQIQRLQTWLSQGRYLDAVHEKKGWKVVNMDRLDPVQLASRRVVTHGTSRLPLIYVKGGR
ncbi:uncharacterized protein CPUR_05853 [Claviceps purpurea 20.1]|uniref:BTB domain-containing protein n=1 Tax=Claviceps purpurea (strain 20.1) TaxID=1111077 RepID=M1W8P2_CLAP2|nr:uncharacterized protein CPUR_05853 [Claviceps purpurea 20.1]